VSFSSLANAIDGIVQVGGLDRSIDSADSHADRRAGLDSKAAPVARHNRRFDLLAKPFSSRERYARKDRAGFVAAKAVGIVGANYVPENLKYALQYLISSRIPKFCVQGFELVDGQQDHSEWLVRLAEAQANVQIWKPVPMRPKSLEVIADSIALQDLVAQPVEAKAASMIDVSLKGVGTAQ
jgi:hypothetical protein